MKFEDLLVKHSYYCSSASYYSTKDSYIYKTFREFYDDMGNSDIDYNMCFRFDVSECENGSDYYCEIFTIQQRKGKFVSFFIESVNEDDFETMKEYLSKHWNHMKELWRPFSNTND